MERLTIRNTDGSVSQPVDLKWAEALERLAAYEDTALVPDAVATLAAKNKELEAAYDAMFRDLQAATNKIRDLQRQLAQVKPKLLCRMERLTKYERNYCGRYDLDCQSCENRYDGCDQDCENAALEALGTIEDILGPTYDLSRLKELVEADREGRFLPVSVGQTLYVISHEGVDEEKVVGIISDGKTIMVEISHFLGVYEYSEKNFGKWVFLTREAAEKALEEKK